MDAAPAYRIQYADGSSDTSGDTQPRFTIVTTGRKQWRRLLGAGLYSAAAAFINGGFDVEGDLPAAIRFYTGAQPRRWRDTLWALLARFGPHRLESWVQRRTRAATNIRCHYDRSNEFYSRFLDRNMVYSCAYFEQPGMPLEQAQTAKLELICRKLDLRPGERFLDVGCGWGALPLHAAGCFGVSAVGYTLSGQQAEYARRRAAHHAVTIHEADYRECSEQFDKIASIGMFEHVGRRRLKDYFRKVYSLLDPDGLFLNHGIVRPEFVREDAQTLFIQRKVFPGGELPRLSQVIRAAELAGFEVLDLEDLRPHYALTCRAWVERLQQNRDECLRTADPATYRTWLLYLAGSAVSFEDGLLNVAQLVLAKRSSPRRRMTRDYMYAAPSAPATAR
jgi:cyclopropane-fatty-acyl-phospholipid synthase